MVAKTNQRAPYINAFWRMVRVLVSIFIAGVIATYGDNVYYLALAPVFNGLSKYIRDKWNINLYLI